MKQQAKTLIERNGFMDPDRKGGKHDEMQAWVLRNPGKILQGWTYDCPGGESIPFTSEHWTLNPVLERVIKTETYKSSMIVGFIDVVLELRSKNEIRSPFTPGKSIVDMKFAIEIKSKIDSIGELIRQINFYRTYFSATWIVVSPEDTFSDILRTQNIYHFKYKDAQKTS